MLTDDKKDKLISYWKEGSAEDLKTAVDIFTNAKSYTAALFYAHFSLEKALKAKVIENTGNHPPYTHNLLHLVTKLGWEPQDDILQILTTANDFNLSGRYPDEKNSFKKKATKEYTESQLQNVQKGLKWISQK